MKFSMAGADDCLVRRFALESLFSLTELHPGTRIAALVTTRRMNHSHDGVVGLSADDPAGGSIGRDCAKITTFHESSWRAAEPFG